MSKDELHRMANTEALGLSSAQLDEMFIAADSLEV